MRVEVDYDMCDANGLCVEVAPEIFQLDGDDELHVLVKHPGPDHEEAAESAARACPKLAIALRETD
ncbi:ferredoxin [Actinomadura sp. CNU-125]|uniref:ferredoxin n=1 Tax=Actinomadura sp. CNU-125 TaxID=1904961 RepID=UPI00095F35A2|nr:ferredoxin [Actinomadura sp. CNU-125]OLT19099.1 ferredoxin [Actinomadura sp. CNU-125]